MLVCGIVACCLWLLCCRLSQVKATRRKMRSDTQAKNHALTGVPTVMAIFGCVPNETGWRGRPIKHKRPWLMKKKMEGLFIILQFWSSYVEKLQSPSICPETSSLISFVKFCVFSAHYLLQKGNTNAIPTRFTRSTKSRPWTNKTGHRRNKSTFLLSARIVLSAQHFVGIQPVFFVAGRSREYGVWYCDKRYEYGMVWYPDSCNIASLLVPQPKLATLRQVFCFCDLCMVIWLFKFLVLECLPTLFESGERVKSRVHHNRWWTPFKQQRGRVAGNGLDKLNLWDVKTNPRDARFCTSFYSS